MSDNSFDLPARLSKTNLIAVSIDICRMLSIINAINDEKKIAVFLDGFYTLCNEHIEPADGEVVKYMGDSCLAVFPADKSVDAIDAVSNLRSAFPTYCESMEVKPTDLQAGVHLGESIIGEFGPLRQRDVLGQSSSIAIQLMSGTGITISEQVYRKLPSTKRSAWKKRGGHVSYFMQ